MSDRFYQGSSRVPNPNRIETSHRLVSLGLEYHLSDEIELSLHLPRREIRREAGGQRTHNLQGLGDVTLLSVYSPWRARGEGEWQLLGSRGLSFFAGLELPTGEDNDRPSSGIPTPSLLQLGSGTFDPILGFSYYGRSGSLSVFQSTSVVLGGGTGDNELRQGDVLSLAAGAGWRLTGSLDATLTLDAEFRSRDKLRGATLADTSSSIWFLTPSLSYRIADDVFLSVSVKLPVEVQVTETQLVPGTQWTLGFVRVF